MTRSADVLEFLLALLTTATVGALLVPLLKQRVARTDRLDNDLAIYRDQLAELEREQAVGALGEAEAKAARTEIERRILAAADFDQRGQHPKDTAALQRFLPPALSLAVPLIALGLYLQMGHPGLPARPFAAAARPPATAAPQDDPAAAIAAVKKQAAEHPDDPEALSALGEALTMEADGVVTQPAVEAFTNALKRAPADPRAAFYLGLHEVQAGDSAAALKRWRELEARSPADAPWLPTLRAEIARLGGTPAPPTTAPPTGAPAMPQPSQDQVEAMSKLSPEERQKTIRTMVDGLEARMQDTPNDRDGWLRLANARKVLGDQAKAADAFARADAISAVDGAPLRDWAEAEVRQLPSGAAPGPRAVAVLERLEKADPKNGLALFYLGAASYAKGDKADAARRWKALLALLPSDAPIRSMLEAKIKEAE
jgi:cytochrome c-type biogenesis protein CcmH